MPCATLHCLVHLIPAELQATRYPAIYNIRYSSPDSPEHYNLPAMVLWATIPYLIWQLSYHFLITVRRRAKIAAGRPTSFTWLRKSYARNFLGKFVLSLPESLQEWAFMAIQYIYAVITMVPCPLWFWSKNASAAFLMAVFLWSVYNGATYYIDVFGTRFQKELEKLKREVMEGKTPAFESANPMDSEGRKSDAGRGIEKELDKVEGPGVGDAGTEPMKLSLGAAGGAEGLMKGSNATGWNAELGASTNGEVRERK